MNKFFLLLLLVTVSIHTKATDITGSNAERIIHGAEIVCTADGQPSPSYMRFHQGQEIPFAYLNKWMQSALHTGSSFGLKLLEESTDEIGFTHYRYQQTWNGLPVYGTMWLVHVQHEKIISCGGNIYPSLSCPVDAVMNESSSLGLALNYMNAEVYQWQDTLHEKMLQREQEDPIASFYPKGELFFAPSQGINQSTQLRLCWRFDVYAQKPLKREYVFVDANTGEIVCSYNRIWNADVTGTAVTAYLGTKTITTDYTGTTYRLREAGRGLGIETYNLQQSSNPVYVNTDFTDADNNWNNVNANLDQYATDAHYGAEMTYDYYKNVLNRNSVNNAGLKLRSYVHYSTNYVNAFWDGTRMTYGDGDAQYKPLTAIDIAGHEISHGVTQYTCALNYQNESGALNEAYSDCIGTAIEFYGAGAKADWTIAEDIGTPFRSMSKPKQYGQPNTYSGTYWYTGTADYGGVHTNSGVMNYWFYLISVGGSGTNDKGTAYNITGLGIDNAAKILYRAWSVYMFSTAQYSDARQATIQATIDLYGACTPQVTTITNAWQAVGVGAGYSSVVKADFTSATVTACSAPAIFQFQNLTSNAAGFKWYFGDGGTSTQANPSHTYTTYNTFSVKLVVTGGCGSDSITKPSYITVDSKIACAIQLPVSGKGAKQTACIGTLYDNGGPIGNYQDLTDSWMTIAPPNANGLKLTFTAFSFEDGYDFVYLYDGPDTTAPVIGKYTGQHLPNGGVVYPSGSVVTIRAKSDPAVDSLGFALTWQCVTLPPIANFSSDFHETCSGIIAFKDETVYSANKWEWNFGDGTTSAVRNPVHTFASNGTYTVKLTAFNAVGSDSITHVDFITVNKPAGPTASKGSSCKAASVTLSASGSGTFNWYDVPSGGTVLHSGSSFTTPVLSSTKIYYAEEVFQSSVLSGGKPNNSGSGGSFPNSYDRYNYIDVLQPVRLVSVDAYVYQEGAYNIEWRNSSGVALIDTTVYLKEGTTSPTKFTINLNWDLLRGTGYEMGLRGSAAFGGLFRNNGGAVYPYTVPGYISITGNNSGQSGYYYYFYNWKLQPYTCISQRQADTAVIALSADVTPSGNISICNGQSLTLSAAPADIYQWSNGKTTQSIDAGSVGTYSVIVTKTGLCKDTSSVVNVSFVSPPSVSFSHTTSDKTITLTNTSTSATTYSWDFGDSSPIDHNKNPIHTYADTGDYEIKLVACNGLCCDSASSGLNISTGIERLNNKSSVIVYPNPSSDKFYIEWNDGTPTDEKISLTNLLGQEVIVEVNAFNKNTWQLNVASLPSGIYYLRIRSEKNNEVWKVMKMSE